MRKVKYEDIRDSIETLDMFIFQGNGFISRFIQLFTKSPYSHVGFGYKTQGRVAPVLLWHSTTLNSVANYFDGNYVKGVQLSELSAVLKTYKGRIFYRKFLPKIPIDMEEVEKLRNHYKGTPYETNMLKLLSAGTTWKWRKKWSKAAQKTIFCTELMTAVFQKLRYQEKTQSPEETSPEHYGENKGLPWINCDIGSIVEIVLT